MKQFSRFHEEDYFEEFKKDLLSLIEDESYHTSPTFIKCKSFYDVFVNVFNHIHHIGFDGMNPNEKKGQAGKNAAVRMPYNKFETLKGDKLIELKQIFEATYRTMACKISCPRGNAFLFCEKKGNTEEDLKESRNLKFYADGSFSNPEHYGKIIINQIAPKTYAILEITNVNEIDLNLTSLNYSFAIPHIVWAKKACGDVFFFDDNSLDFSRINIIDFFNTHNAQINLVQHEINKTSTRLNIELFHESDFIYSISVDEVISAGRLKERESYFKGRVDFKSGKWLSLEGNSSIESLK